jgi:molybdopterin molybdotransferase
MPEFLQLLPPHDALRKVFEVLPPPWPVGEDVLSENALGRVLNKPVFAPHPLPAFPRSTVDGYAVRAVDTYGASDGLPAYLTLLGEVPMGSEPDFKLKPAHAALIHTGGMLPEAADAVVMVEYTQSVRPEEIEIMRPVAVAENVLKVGEDVAAGQEVIPTGTRLRPADIGGLMALGILKVPVACPPRVGIISSGDEVVPPEMAPRPGQVRDVNAYTLSALVEATGGQPVRYGIIPDRVEPMRQAAEKALQDNDLIVITAGSSASTRDLTAEIVNQLGSPGVLAHGVNVRPGKPTILAVCNGKPVIGLPGNPVSALVIAGIFVSPLIEYLLGLRRSVPHSSVTARLSLNQPSQAGREDWVPVRLSPGPDGWMAEPVFGKSNLIFTLARADGLLKIPPDATGISAGEIVDIMLL